MRRSAFICLTAALPMLGAAKPTRDAEIPVELRGGRFFAVPRTLDGRIFACWLDTDGSGFIFDSAVERFGLRTESVKGKRAATLPTFSAASSLPPLSIGNTLAVFERDKEADSDPILQGFDAQLGRSWFAGRVWLLDFRRAKLTMIANSLPRNGISIALAFERGYPYLAVYAGNDGDAVRMSFDIAASVAYAPRRDRPGGVHATSFVRRDLFERWHRAHPQWRVERNVSTLPDVDLIVVPALRVGAATLSNVAFTTRRRDDVFEGTMLAGKLGANAYANAVVGIDYPNATLTLELPPD